MISVSHVITGLEQGGAEVVLLRLLQRTDLSRFRMRVISISGEGRLSSDIRALGVPIDNLDVNALAGIPIAVIRCLRLLRRNDPHVIQTWMYHGDLIGGLAARLGRMDRVVWGLHAGTLPPADSRLARGGIKFAARLSSWIPKRIVCCSHSAREVHSAAGYDESRMIVIENGFELPETAGPDREAVRAQLGVEAGVPVITRVGRFHPQKDYPTFIKACGEVHRHHPHAVFVMVGLHVDLANDELMERVRETGIEPNVRLLGLRRDVSAIYSASDVAVSSSGYGEALPLALGEAMAAGIPIVTTDVGDSARLVSDPARVVPPQDPAALGAAIRDVLALSPTDRRELGARDQERIANSYSLERMAQVYFELYEQVASEKRPH